MEVSKKIVTENAKTWSSAFIIIFKKEHQTDNWKKLMYKYEPVLRTFLTPNMWIFFPYLQSILQLSGHNWMSNNSIKFWY